MIVRIVELYIEKEHIDRARELVEEVSPKVRGFEGCSYLEILSDVKKAGHLTTYSHWSSVDALNKYRDSEVFISFWKQIKPLFAKPAKAWSSEVVDRFS